MTKERIGQLRKFKDKPIGLLTECLDEIERLQAEINLMIFSQNVCVGAAGCGDFSELCGSIDRLKSENRRLQADNVALRKALDRHTPCLTKPPTQTGS